MSAASFSGFPRDSLFTPVPNPLFGPLLEEIQDLAELKVTLRGMWLLHRKKGPLQCLTPDELMGDLTLIRGLGDGRLDPAEEVRRGLELALGRGTFICHREADGSPGKTPVCQEVPFDTNVLSALPESETDYTSEVEDEDRPVDDGQWRPKSKVTEKRCRRAIAATV